MANLQTMLLPVVCMGFMTACADRGVSEEVRAAHAWSVRETVFRYQFDNNGSGGQKNVDFYFLSPEEGVDLPQAFLDRFVGHVPEVFPASAVAVPDDTDLSPDVPDTGVSHKDKGGSGLIFYISEMRWLSNELVEVVGGYHEGSLSASLNVYRVEYHDGQWTVTKRTLLAVS